MYDAYVSNRVNIQYKKRNIKYQIMKEENTLQSYTTLIKANEFDIKLRIDILFMNHNQLHK